MSAYSVVNTQPCISPFSTIICIYMFRRLTLGIFNPRIKTLAPKTVRDPHSLLYEVTENLSALWVDFCCSGDESDERPIQIVNPNNVCADFSDEENLDRDLW